MYESGYEGEGMNEYRPKTRKLHKSGIKYRQWLCMEHPCVAICDDGLKRIILKWW